MPIYEQIPVRLQINMAGSPPYPPFDANTGFKARFWRGTDVSFQLGLFDAFGVPVDLSNLVFLQLVLQSGPTALVPLVVKTVQSVDIRPLTVEEWAAGLGQQASFDLTAAETDQSLEAMESRDYWVSIQGKTIAGALLTYGAGYVTLYDAGSAIPAPNTGAYVSRHSQQMILGDSMVFPTSFNHTEIVEVQGTARISNLILSISGMANGALARVRFDLPATPGIAINVCSGLVSNVISTIATGSVLSAYLDYVFDADTQQWVPLSYIIPATI